MAARRKRQVSLETDVSQSEETVGEGENRSAPQVVEVVDEQSEETSPTPEQTETSELPQEQKEVVEDLFQEEVSQVPSSISRGENGSRKKTWVWALVVIGIALLVGGGLIWVVRGRGGLPSLGASPTPTPTVVPTPTPSTELKREDLTIQVLNGGGVAGTAGQMKTLLEEKGYTVSDVGNTEQYTYDETEIHVKADKEAYLALLTQDLSGEYTIGSSSAELDEDVSYDARIIVGKE